MGWRDRLQAGRFRTAEFRIEAHDESGGRRLALHEYPLRDEPYAEDLGRKAGEFTLECFVLGEDYMAARDALREALRQKGPGVLVHPYLGTLRVAVRDYRLRETTSQGGMATFSITFVEAGRAAEPDISADTASGVGSAADSALAASEQQFANVFEVSGFTQFVADAATGQLNGAATSLRSLSSRIRSAAVISDFGALVGSPSALAAQVTASVASLADGAASLSGAFQAYRTLWPFGNDDEPVPGATPSRTQQAANQLAVSNLLQRSATLEAARTASGMLFASSGEATGMRELFTVQFDALLNAADSDDLYDTLVMAHTAVVRDLNTRAARLPRTRTLTLAATEPALVLAHRLYGDATRAEDVVSRNRIRHPGFMPGGVPLEVLSDAA